MSPPSHAPLLLLPLLLLLLLLPVAHSVPATTATSTTSATCASGYGGPGCAFACPANCTTCTQLPDSSMYCLVCGNSLYLKNNGGPQCVNASVCLCSGNTACAAAYSLVGNGTTGRVCQPKDVCPPTASTNPCNFNGTCVSEFYEENNRLFTCICPLGFGGDEVGNCYDEYCSPNPCHNGGTCHNNGTAAICTCNPAYTGNRCQTEVNFCLSDPCQNNQNCSHGIGGFTCNCNSSYTGTYCQTLVPCTPNPCNNNGVCRLDTRNADNFACTCPNGYTGATCQYALDPCQSSPCKNGAACTAGQDYTYACTCRLGWTGPTCDSLGDCASSPCQNGGLCDPNKNGIGFNCSCIGVYYGSLCEYTNACESNPCLNTDTPTCNNNGNSYYCSCGASNSSCSDSGSSSASTGNKSSSGGSVLSLPVIIGIAVGACLLLLLGLYVILFRGGYIRKGMKRKPSKPPKRVTSFANPAFVLPDEDRPGHYVEPVFNPNYEETSNGTRQPVFNGNYEPMLTGRRPINNSGYTPLGSVNGPSRDAASAPGYAPLNASTAAGGAARQPVGNAGYSQLGSENAADAAGKTGRQPVANPGYAQMDRAMTRNDADNAAISELLQASRTPSSGRRPVGNPNYASGPVTEANYVPMDEPQYEEPDEPPAPADHSYLSIDTPQPAAKGKGLPKTPESGYSRMTPPRGSAPTTPAADSSYLQMMAPQAATDNSYLAMSPPSQLQPPPLNEEKLGFSTEEEPDDDDVVSEGYLAVND